MSDQTGVDTDDDILDRINEWGDGGQIDHPRLDFVSVDEHAEALDREITDEQRERNAVICSYNKYQNRVMVSVPNVPEVPDDEVLVEWLVYGLSHEVMHEVLWRTVDMHVSGRYDRFLHECVGARDLMSDCYGDPRDDYVEGDADDE